MAIPIAKLERREAPSTEVARKLLEYLLSGELVPGDRIPSERQLATSLGIGRSAVRDALRPLTWLGIVEVRQGDGTYLRGMSSDLLPKVVEWGLMLGEKRVMDLVEARRHIETVTARLAAERRTDAGAEEVRNALALMEASLADRAALTEADIAFHLKVAELAGNDVLSGILSSIQSLLRVWISRLLLTADDPRASYMLHVPIAEAVIAGDGDRAAAAMTAHLNTATDLLLVNLAESAGSRSNGNTARA